MMRPMAGKPSGLPTGVFPKGRWYYRVRAEGAKRVWVKLSPISEGLPALYTALAKALSTAAMNDSMPALIAAWKASVMLRHKPKTQYNESHMLEAIAQAFRDFKADQVEAPDCAEFLQAWLAKPRSYNAYRSMLRELMRFAIERGHRRSNPVDAIRTLATPARKRYITDSELRRIKVGAIYGDDGRPTRSGRMICALIDVAYLSGQRIGDLLALRWQPDPDDLAAPYVAADGLHWQPGKTADSTAARVHITWTPKLKDAIERVRQIQAERLLKRRAGQRVVSGYLFTGQDGKPLTYSGAASAWKRAVRRADVRDAHFHDIRAKAVTDVDQTHGRRAARRMGAHSTEGQTADYIRNRRAEPVKATR